MSPDDPRHGTVSGHIAHQRAGGDYCDPCIRAKAMYDKRRKWDASNGRVYTVSSLGARRRVKALQAMGWGRQPIAEAAGWKTSGALRYIDRSETITRATHIRIAEAYERLAMRQPPDEMAARRTQTWAKRHGHAPPLAYNNIDDPQEDPAPESVGGFTRWNTFEERYWGRVEKSADCWLWVGKLTAKGYGTKTSHQGVYRYPHQIAYTLANGPIPDGLVIDHLCRVRHCVNPDHLEAITAVENTQRGVAARWLEPCAVGHDPADRRALPSGKNVCIGCRRASDNERDDRDRDARRAAARARYEARQQTLDPVVVERLLSGDVKVRSNRFEKSEALRRWIAAGNSERSLCERMGWKDGRYGREGLTA